MNPATKTPIPLEAIFCKEMTRRETTSDRFVKILDGVSETYRTWRLTPIYRARSLEKALKTSAKIYNKYEGVSPTESHKQNTAIPQAYYNNREGVKSLTTETVTGQEAVEQMAMADEYPDMVIGCVARETVIDESLECKRTGTGKTIFTFLSGHGVLDMKAYESFLDGRL